MKRGTRSLRTWDFVHRWTSLVCTAFMLLLCLTGLPLIFHHEIDHALGTALEVPDRPGDVGRVSMDRVVDVAHATYPGRMILFASREPDDERAWYVTMATSPSSDDLVQVAVDARDGRVLGTPRIGGEGVMSVILSLHVDLFAGLPGKLFLGAMGVLLIASIVSGVVLYAPFMRKLAFGTVRAERATRVKWLDLHNLIGIVTLTWALVVGATGVVNTWAELVVAYWQSTEMAEMLAAYRDAPPLTATGQLQRSVDAALAREPERTISFIAFPGSSFSSPHHYGIFMRGDSPLTSRLVKPVLVDARTAVITDSRDLPWYLTALLLSQPLHFGDYGGMGLKIAWAALDVATIVVLVSGLYLYVGRFRRPPRPAPRGVPTRHRRAVR